MGNSKGEKNVAAPAQVCVRVFTLGRFLLQVDDVPLRFGRKTQRRPLQLLKTLIAMGGDAVSVEQLCEALWPDADGDHAHDSFRSALSRLRKLIGSDAIRLQDGRLSLDQDACWVDVQVFERSLGQAREVAGTVNDARTSLILEEALSTYQGPFLDGEFDPPEILSARERLHSRFLRSLSELGAIYRRHGQYAQAIDVYRKGLEIDSLGEEVYQQLMRCYLEAGRIAEGMAVYQRCRDTLRAQIGIEPSEETKALHQALRGSEGQPHGAAPAPADPSDTVAAPLPEVPLPAERRLVTVVTCALEGYAGLCEGLAPEGLQAFTSRYHEALAHSVESEGGVTNAVRFHEATAVFGLPTAHEDDPARAVRAVLQAHEKLATLVGGLPPGKRRAVGFKAAVATGTVIPQTDPSGRCRYMLVGDAERIAERLLVEALRGQTLIDERTHRRCRFQFQTEPKPEPRSRTRLRGPPAAYRVTGVTELHTPFEIAAHRGFTPLAGRKVELSLLEECLRRAIGGEGQLVTVSGEAGIGKSRLVHEFGRQVDRGQVTVVEGHCQTYGVDTPYLPFLDALRRGLGLDAERSVTAARARLVAEISAIDPALRHFLPHYLHLLSIPSADHALPEPLQGPELASALRAALCAVFTASARTTPLLVILEDWHWADEASIAVLRELAGLVGASRLMLLVTHRPAGFDEWTSFRSHTPLRLRPLDAADTASIVRALWNVEALPAGAASAIHARTGGNPYFTEETCRTLLEEGVVSVQGGWASWVPASDELVLPDSVQAVIRTRIDRLHASDRELLQVASVIGREFPLALLRESVGSSRELESALERCRALQLVEQAKVVPESSFRFVHVLAQMVVYDTLPDESRRALHGAVGRTIESRYADSLQEQLEVLAYHFTNHGDARKAVHYLEQAGDKAAARHSIKESAAHYRAALQMLVSEQPSSWVLERERSVLEKYAYTCFWAERLDIPLLEQLLAQASRSEDRELEYRVYDSLIFARFSLGNFVELRPRLKEYLRTAESIGSPLISYKAFAYDARCKMHEGEFSAGVDLIGKAVAMGTELDPYQTYLLRSSHVSLHALVGDFGAMRCTMEQVEDSRNRLEKTSLRTALDAMSLGYTGSAMFWQGHWDLAESLSSQCIELCKKMAIRLPLAWGLNFRGAALSYLGRGEQGIPMMEEAVRIIKDEGITIGLSNALAYLAESYALAGHVEQAANKAQEVLQLVSIGNRFGEIVAHHALAMVAAQSRPPDWALARKYLHSSARLATQRGAKPQLAITHFRHAEILQKKGDSRGALEQQSKAATLFDALGMAGWPEQAAALRDRIEKGAPFMGFAPVPS